MTYTKVNTRNYKDLFYRIDGNLYYQEYDDIWYVVDGATEEDIRNALRNKCPFIFIEGPAKNPFLLERGKINEIK